MNDFYDIVRDAREKGTLLDLVREHGDLTLNYDVSDEPVGIMSGAYDILSGMVADSKKYDRDLCFVSVYSPIKHMFVAFTQISHSAWMNYDVFSDKNYNALAEDLGYHSINTLSIGVIGSKHILPAPATVGADDLGDESNGVHVQMRNLQSYKRHGAEYCSVEGHSETSCGFTRTMIKASTSLDSICVMHLLHNGHVVCVPWKVK